MTEERALNMGWCGIILSTQIAEVNTPPAPLDRGENRSLIKAPLDGKNDLPSNIDSLKRKNSILQVKSPLKRGITHIHPLKSPLKRGDLGVCNHLPINSHDMRIHYDKNLKELAKRLRNNSTRTEVLLWHYLKGKQMMGYDFDRQKPIDRFIVDFFCNKLRLAIELDGYSHDFDSVYEKDLIKEKRLNELGIKVLRFDDNEVFQNMDNVLREIEGFIEEFENDTPPAPLDRGEETQS